MARKRAGFEASEWQPPAEMARIAEERTADIRHVFAASAPWKPLDLAILARSCYMQGINDVIDSLHQRHLTIVAAADRDAGEIYWP